MANPSLQIGNSNWAIKEDNLLGYSTAGTRFVPQPITMTRASAGTRVNSSGLVETVELLGSEEVDCGDFSCAVPLDSWTISGGNAEITSGLLNFTNATSFGTSVLNSSTVLAGISYEVRYTISNYISGSTRIRLGSEFGANRNANGDYVETVIASNTSILFYSTSANTTLSIDNVSVKESTKNNLARVDYDGTASSLLVEPQRTNLIPYSEDFSQSTWIASNQTVSLSEVLSPNGTSFSYKLTATANYSKIREDLVLNATTTYTVSFYTKNISAANPRIVAYDQNNSVTLLTQSYGSELSNSEWVRITGTFTTTTAATIQLQICRDLMDSEEMLIWGAQLEQGSYATSYIPTDGSTVTRVQDQYSKTGISNLINSEEGVLFLEVAFLSETDPVLQRISINDGTNSNRIIIQANPSSNTMQIYLINSSGAQTSSIYTLANKTNFNKIAFKWKVNDFAVWSNGTEVITDTSGTTFSSGILNRITFEGATGSNNFYGKVKQLQVFKTALTDTELATLTTI